MTEDTHTKSLKPHIVLAVVIVAVVIIAYFSLSSSDKPEPVEVPIPEIPVAEPDVQAPVVAAVPEEPESYATEDDATAMEEPSIVDLPDPVPEPEPLDTSDATVKTSLLNLANYETAARLLVNEDLLQRFVVYTENMANQSIATNHQIVVPPEQGFSVYQQSGKTFIDIASFKRYKPYVETFTAMDTESLISLFNTYKPALDDIYAEIGNPEDEFRYVLIDAINHVLDTPEIPMPIEVYTQSVMYKFKNDKLENLTAPQKQLLRTGPENMRQIKAKLRDLRDALE